MDRCKTIDEVIARLTTDSVEFVRFEASNINGQSFGKMIPVRQFKSMAKSGLAIFCGSWFFGADYSITYDTLKNGLTFRNSYNFVYPQTYTLIPYILQAKVARVMMYPYVDKQIWPVDPRSICLRQLLELKKLGYELFSAFEHEFQMINKQTNLPLWSGTEYCNLNKASLNEDFMFKCEKYLYSLGIDIETMHIEYAPGQYEWTMKPTLNLISGDNSFTFRNSIKQITNKYNNNWLATFATTPFPANQQGASNGAHFNFSLWKDPVPVPVPVPDPNANPIAVMDNKDNKDNDDDNDNDDEPSLLSNKVNAFYDPNGDILISDVGMYFIGGIMEHIRALTLFANITPNCYRRTNAHSWSPGNATWGRNNRTVLLRIKNDGNNGTYFEYRLPGSACNPYNVMTSVIAAGIHGIQNKIKPKTKECTEYALDPKFDNITKVPENINIAISELKKDKVIWNAFGDKFCNMFIHSKELEFKNLKTLADKVGLPKAETQFYLDI